ncbi:hypothetical protein [Bradyrhizobium ottawaense]
MFVIFDLGRYAITMQSLRTLASAGARAVMISCYTPALLQVARRLPGSRSRPPAAPGIPCPPPPRRTRPPSCFSEV